MEVKWVGQSLAVVHGLDFELIPDWATRLESLGIPGVMEAAPAWSTLGVYVEPNHFRVDDLLAVLEGQPPAAGVGKLHAIPVCFELGPDLTEVALEIGSAENDVITILCERPLVCRAIGFCPGFPYLGPLDGPLADLPRRASPRTRVEPGSVAVAAGQAGIYPLPKPGGWNLLGRTPLTIVDVDDDWFPISPGDQVQFQPVGLDDFRALEGERL